MSFPKSRFAKISAIILAVLIFLIFISLIVLSKVILPREVRNYVEEISKDTGYKVEIKEIKFDFFSGFKGKEIEVSDPLSLANPILRVAKVAVKPEILSSLVNWKIKVRGIIIDKSVFSFTKEELDNLMKLIKEKEEEIKRKEEKSFPIEIEHLEITDAQIEVASLDSVHLKKIEIDFEDTKLKEGKVVKLSGLINLQNNEMEIHGEIKPFLDTPVGELKINLPELNTGVFSTAVQSPEKLSVFSEVSFQISDKITSQGIINFRPARDGARKTPPFSGKLEYDLTYDKSSDTALLNSLNLNIYELIRISFAGRVEKLRKEGIFNLEGKAERIGLENISRFFPDLSYVEFLGDVKADDIKIMGSIRDKNISASLKTSFLDGLVFGDIEFRTLNGERVLRGKLEGKNLNLREILKNYVFINLEGKLPSLNTEFISRDMKGFNADVYFSLRDFKLESGKSIIKVAKAETTESLKLKFSHKSEDAELRDGHFDRSQNGGSDAVSRHSQNEIIVESKGLSYENFSFKKATIKSGNLSGLLFKLGENNGWTLNVSSTGSQFKIPDKEVYLKQFRVDIHKERDGRRDIWGSLSGKEGRYKDASFPALSTDFEFNKNLLKLTNLKMQIGSYGELKTKELNILLGDQKNGTPYTLAFTQGSFSGFNQEVKSKGIKGEFFYAVDRKKPTWDGNIFISDTDIFESQLKNLSLRIKLSSEGVNLEKISGRFLGGNLGGSVWVKTRESPHLISSDLEFRKVVLPLNKLALSLGRLDFKFKGELGKGLFPQGSGKVNLNGLKIGEESTAYPLSGQIELQTIGETIILKEGFIESEKGVTVNFIGKMESSLNRNMRFQIDLPQAPLTSIQEILSPTLPGVLREGEATGNVSLNLTLTRSTEEDISWDGKIYLKDASIKGKLSGVHFLINNINGTIPLIDETKPENPLNSLIERYSKPEKKLFETTLSTLTQDGVGREEDTLEIKEIEYGFLRFEDIELVLELDRNKLNLKQFESKLYGGNVFSTGQFKFGEKEHKYNLSFLLKDVSLKSASNAIPSTKDYITGRINGIGWLSNEGGKLNTLDGSFNLWTIKSKKEPRRVGRALLTKLGVKEQFLLRSSRRYNKGEIYGYIKDGVITFKEFQISHSIFGIKDLLIQVDKKRNSISVAHFLSVIRETARRASEGRLKIEINK